MAANGRHGYSCNLEVRIKGVTSRPVLFSQMRRSDGEALVVEELLDDPRPVTAESEREREHEERLRALMDDIVEWAVSLLSGYGGST